MIDASLPQTLTIMCQPLLSPMQLKIKDQKPTSCGSMRAGMAQRDPPSPILFNIFMDGIIVHLNIRRTRGVVGLFVNDMIALARSAQIMQELIDRFVEWATDVGMQWTVSKCSSNRTPKSVTINEERFKSQDFSTYLGISPGRRAVTEHGLPTRREAARNILSKLWRTTTKWRKSVRQRRMFVMTNVYSIMDYLLYIQLLTPGVYEKAQNLEISCLSFILHIPITARTAQRVSLLSTMMPIRARRITQMFKAVAKFFAVFHISVGNPVGRQELADHVRIRVNRNIYNEFQAPRGRIDGSGMDAGTT